MFYALGSVDVAVAPYLVTLLTALAACLLILATATLLDADREWPLGRLAQGLRLGTLRMGRMLRRRGIAVERYAATLSVATLRRQAELCAGCGCKAVCDRALKSRGGANSHSHFTFCPNQPAIERYLLERAHIQV